MEDIKTVKVASVDKVRFLKDGRCGGLGGVCAPRLLRPRAYRAVAGVGVWSEHNLKDGFRFGS